MDLCREMEFPDCILKEMLETQADNVRESILEAIQYKPQLSPGLSENIAVSLGDDILEHLKESVIDALGRQSSLPEKPWML